MNHGLVRPLIAAALILAASSGNAVVVSGQEFGAYPACYAPSVPLEVHSWWLENGETHPRHVHIGACIPSARDTSGKLVSFSGKQTFPNRALSFNNPGEVNLVRWAWESNIKQEISLSNVCQSAPDLLAECRWPVNMTLDANLASSGGLHELRLTPNVQHADLGKRQFATLNFQVYLNNGKTPSNYRSSPDPIARSWYTGFGYANVQVNYMNFFTDLNQTIPVVSGIVPLKVKHSSGSFARTSYLFQDPDFHAYPSSHGDPSNNPTGKTVLLYKKSGLFSGTYNWDTRSLENGTHALYFQTEDKGDAGTHAGALRLLFQVQN